MIHHKKVTPGKERKKTKKKRQGKKRDVDGYEH